MPLLYKLFMHVLQVLFFNLISIIDNDEIWGVIDVSSLSGFFLQMLAFSNSLIFYTWEQDTHLLLTGGVEKILRIYDMNRPDAPPREVDKSPGSVRTVAWLHSDQTILSSCTDMGGVRYILH